MGQEQNFQFNELVGLQSINIALDQDAFTKPFTNIFAPAQATAQFLGQKPRLDFGSLTHNPTRSRWTIHVAHALDAHAQKAAATSANRGQLRQRGKRQHLVSAACLYSVDTFFVAAARPLL